ncbi:hypothetical protein MPSEU_000532500 [Mayamaea pseudoterrestris]|nr:hypothetical protein MPSEU_000532500 [Mayamaea pseudoterrestris]
MMYGDFVFHQGASRSGGLMMDASNHGNSSSSLKYSHNDATTNPFSSYRRSYSTNSDSMLYYKDKPVHKESRLLNYLQKLLNEPWNVVALLLFLGVIAGCHQRATKAWLLKEFHSQSYHEAVSIWQEVQQDHLELANEFDQLYTAQTKWEHRDLAWRTHVQRLHNFTQRESRRAVLDKFGPGPHHVSIKVVLPSDNPSTITINPETQLLELPKHDPSKVRSFQVELAPLSEMPHAVHLFLEQVSHKLWDKASSFYVNHDHVMQAGPRTREARQHFTDYNLEKLAFPEYSHAFPHKQWTLGFAGRPGGPSFYINKINNEEDHGPFGQEHHALDEFADSCFAKIVSGFDTLSEIIRQTDGQHHTQIVGMEVVSWSDHWTDSQDAHWRTAHQQFDDVSLDSTDDALFADENSATGTPAASKASNEILQQQSPQHVEPVHHHAHGQVQQMLVQRDDELQPRHHRPPSHYNHHAARHLEGFHETHVKH